MIRIDGLRVTYGSLCAVDSLTLDVPRGALFGLLGPNGAGKTTTIRCIAGLVVPSAGSVTVGGVDAVAHPAEVRRRIGVVPQQLALYDELTVLQNLRVLGGVLGLSGARLADRVEWALELAQLRPRVEARVETLSGGMKRRLNLASSLLHGPECVICDEPTTGVDPQSRLHIFDTIRRLRAEGSTVVYTTHYMEEVEALCDRVAIIDHGRLVTAGTLRELLAGSGTPLRHSVTLRAGASGADLAGALSAAGLDVDAVVPTPRSLEDIFLERTGHSLRDEA
ncbi:MAG: ABC transporter ATP-binding protein [Deltaproteobacteria bacterium]|nr:ABC transporter ATP-binding protein [Deltaproteobacteria bacterium]MCB9787513.1 ABC transporter ATP-binding protein [Deltaproteobacteria bacterium]